MLKVVTVDENGVVLGKVFTSCNVDEIKDTFDTFQFNGVKAFIYDEYDELVDSFDIR